jgi:transcriptional regulator with XRE-family HTH domain
MLSSNAPQSSMQASLSPLKSGNMAPSNTVLVAGVLDMAETLEGFAQRLRELRKQKNLSQTELGQLAGLHYTHVGRFERGTSRPSGDTLKRVADALGVTSDYLLDGATNEAAKARFEDRELLKQFQEVEQLPDEDKNVVKKLLDAFLTKKQLQVLAR